MTESIDFTIRAATETDVPVLLRMIRSLAEYEKLSHEVIATEASLCGALFGAKPVAEAVLGYAGPEPVAFAVFFRTFSTFLGAPGLYLEDIFVQPPWRGQGLGKRLLAHLAETALERGCIRLEWAVLDWNEPAIRFYRSLGAEPREACTIYRLGAADLRRLSVGAGRIAQTSFLP
jgi:GNAT superfamily N-acetyltransferase